MSNEELKKEIDILNERISQLEEKLQTAIEINNVQLEVFKNTLINFHK